MEIENNSGVEFPGLSLESVLNSGLRVANLIDNNTAKDFFVIEFRESEKESFAFKFNGNEKYLVANCEWCNKKNIMKTICKCKNVRYCDQSCLEKDINFHSDKCSANADGELREQDDGEMHENSVKGLCGLINIGNSCYLASSI